MYSQEQHGLWEAYQSIYTQSQELTEEVEIAAQYFYEMGLNEDGIEILIEELGVEEFADFVYDIAEEYVLTEARAGGVKIEPKLSSGKPIQGKPKAASLKALRKKKAARQEAEERASSEKPSGMKASLQRQAAISAASKKQPKKPGVLDRVAGAISRGMERDREARAKFGKAARETGDVLGRIGRAAAGVARDVTGGVYDTGRLAGHLAKKGLKEEVEVWVNSLIEEGYDLSAYTWDDMFDIYLNESGWHRRNPGESEEFEYFDTILEYLISEGYADTDDAALKIMANMSKDWVQSIVEGAADKKAPPEYRAKFRNARAGFITLTGDKATQVRRREHSERRGVRGNIGGEGGSSYRYDDNSDKDYPSFRVRGRGKA